jgi:predicted alpha/beta-fold hydrolase
VEGPVETMLVPVSESSAVQVQINHPPGSSHGTLLLVHGMGGSAESGYMRRTAAQALGRGWTPVRMNLRNCGGTEALSRTLYNAGQSADVGRVLGALEAAGLPRPFAAVGFSLGGNLVLRHAALAGVGCRADSVFAINPPIDLERCARALELPANRVYQMYYTRKLVRALRRILAVRKLSGFPPPDRSIRSVRRFDQLYTAPDGGFASAEEYYAQASAAPHLGRLTRPAVVISAADDPVVPVEMFAPHHGLERVRFVHPRQGGHCGYWQSSRPRFWASTAVLHFLDGSAGKG